MPGYRVHRLIGVGASAAVWSATGPGGADVALKVVSLSADDGARGPWALAQRAASVSALQREITALTQVDHPRVVALRAVVPREGSVVLVLDRAAGGSLGALVRARGSLDVGEVIEMVAGLATVLAELHDRGLVHGDVSPGNVLFEADGTAVLADLGLASLVEALSRGPVGADPGALGSLDGAPPVLEPAHERALGTQGFADPAGLIDRPTMAGDVHGLAAVAWFALTSSVPGLATHRVPLSLLVPEAPPALVQVLDDAMSPVPGQRPTAADLAAAVAASGPSEGVHLVPSAPGAPQAELLTQRLRAAARAAQEEEAATRVPLWRRGRWGVAAVGAVAVVFVSAWALSGWLLADGGPLVGSRSAASAGSEPAATAAEEAASEPAVASSPGTPRPTATPPPGEDRTSEGADGSGEEPLGDPALVDPALSDPLVVVSALAGARARAFESGDVSLLGSVDAGGSPAHDVDAEAITSLVSAGASVESLTFEVLSARVVAADGAAGTARVETSVMTGGHQQRLADGRIVEVPESGPVTSVLVLRLTDEGWRIDATA